MVGEDEKHIYLSNPEHFGGCIGPSRVFEGRELDLILWYDVVTLKAIEIFLRCLKENGRKIHAESSKGHPTLGISREVIKQP